MKQRPALPNSLASESDPLGEAPKFFAAALDELRACEKRSAAFGKMIVGQEVWHLLLTIYVDQMRAETACRRPSDFDNVQRRWLRVLAFEGMLEADATNRLHLSDHAVRSVEQCLAR